MRQAGSSRMERRLTELALRSTRACGRGQNKEADYASPYNAGYLVNRTTLPRTEYFKQRRVLSRERYAHPNRIFHNQKYFCSSRQSKNHSKFIYRKCFGLTVHNFGQEKKSLFTRGGFSDILQLAGATGYTAYTGCKKKYVTMLCGR
jgi:hypothetical protein